MSVTQQAGEVIAAVARAATGPFLNGDPRPLKRHWSFAGDVTIFGGYGGFEHGWSHVGPRLDWAANSFRGGHAEYEPITSGVNGNLAYAIGIERGYTQAVDAATATQHALRVTHIFRHEHGEWRLIHRHADPLVDAVAR